MQDWREAWYLLRCKQSTWKTTLENLNEFGLQTCCPLVYERRKRKDKENSFRIIKYPAFPGYIFVYFNPSLIHTTAIKRIPGAMDFVHFGNSIATIGQKEIHAINMAMPKLVTANSERFECVGMSDELIEKIEIIYSTADPEHRVSMLMSLLDLSRHQSAACA